MSNFIDSISDTAREKIRLLADQIVAERNAQGWIFEDRTTWLSGTIYLIFTRPAEEVKVLYRENEVTLKDGVKGTRCAVPADARRIYRNEKAFYEWARVELLERSWTIRVSSHDCKHDGFDEAVFIEK